MNYLEVEEIVRRALIEDIGSGDITTALTIPSDSISQARIVAKEEGVVAGLKVAAAVLEMVAGSFDVGRTGPSSRAQIRPGAPIRVSVKRMGKAVRVGADEPASAVKAFGGRDLAFAPEVVDGTRVLPGETIASIDGPTAIILTGERVALNFLQRMSGIATKTANLVEMVKHTGARVTDTRKTTPGLRILEKYAVRMGGGQNHRFGLYDAVLIKDNHIQACGGIVQAIRAARAGAPHTVKVEVETDTLEQVEQALEAGADMILLDNMSPETLRRAVSMCRGRALTEASGTVREDTIVAVAESGVDIISVGALTHSVRSMDISLDILE